MKKFIDDIVIALKGVAMGAANIIPGVSGGTIALITGIFERLVEALNSIMTLDTWKILLKGNFREFWKKIDGRFLVDLMIGVLLSILSLAKLMEYLLHNHPVQTWAFFFGLIIASSILMLKDIKDWTFKDVIFTIIGIILGLVVCTLTPTETPDALWFVFLCGAIAICTMILPGISGSFILVILGQYDHIMTALNDTNLLVVSVFGLGCVIGLLAFSKFLHWLLARYQRPTLLILIGFVLGALVKVWPWSDKAALIAADGSLDNLHIPGAIIYSILGVLLVIGLELLSHRHKESSED